MKHIEDILARHERIALQLSGGKDSLACLYLLRPYWGRITVYWCNPGAPFPETVECMERIKSEVPNFVEIDGRQLECISTYGIPSDIVPATRTQIGLAVDGRSAQLIQDRYSCCYRSMMEPTLERMKADGITLVIRGQRADDALKAPIQSGHVEDGVEYFFPIERWDVVRVMNFLRTQHVPIPRFYTMLKSAPDCTTCSAWWEEGAAAYLKTYHPEAHAEVQRRLDIIKVAVSDHIAAFNNEVNA